MGAPLAFIEEINSTIAQSSGDRRAQMVRHLTDLFLVNSDQYSDDEISLIDDVFVRLVASVEVSARALLAIRLGPMSGVPPKILSMLACDNVIDVAAPILIRSDGLDDAVLIGCAQTKSQEHLLAISRRKALTTAVTDILVERGDQQVVLSIARNAGAKFSDNGFSILVRRSDSDDLLATSVGRRLDIPPHLFHRLLETASETVRSKLTAEMPSAQHDIDHVVGGLTDRIRTQATLTTQQFAAAQVLVETLSQSGQLDSAKLMAFAAAGQFEETIVALGLMADMPTQLVERKLNDEHAEFLLVLTKAIGLSWPTTKAILALGSGKQRCSPGELAQHESAFQRLNQPTAQQILGFHRTKGRSGHTRKM